MVGGDGLWKEWRVELVVDAMSDLRFHGPPKALQFGYQDR
jgi:hypothetical protein